jgi:hypothetical protein
MSTTPPPADTPPDDDKSKSLFDKLGAAMPIGLTALATVFAGMSTSELQRAMFWRTAAGQDQAKSTNQWTLAGFKRNRALIMEGTGAQLGAQPAYKAVDWSKLRNSAKNENEKTALEWLQGKGPPRENLPKPEDDALNELTKAIKDREPEGEILKRAARVKLKAINEAIDNLEKANEEIDSRWDKVVKAAGKLVAQEGKGNTGEAIALRSAWFAMEQRRYRSESFFNQQIGFLYDARVRVVTAISDHHRKRSENFFYAMLAAQIGAVISSLALARKQKSALWLMAGLAGAVAVGFGAYVYLTM